MIEFFQNGGSMMWLLLIIAFLIIFLTSKKTIQLFSKRDLPEPVLENGINAIIFWGSIAAVLGFFAHYLGIFPNFCFRSTEARFNRILFIISAIIWFILRWRYRRLVK